MLSGGALGLVLMLLLKEALGQPARAAGEVPHGYGRVNPSQPLGGQGLFGPKPLGPLDGGRAAGADALPFSPEGGRRGSPLPPLEPGPRLAPLDGLGAVDRSSLSPRGADALAGGGGDGGGAPANRRSGRRGERGRSRDDNGGGGGGRRDDDDDDGGGGGGDNDQPVPFAALLPEGPTLVAVQLTPDLVATSLFGDAAVHGASRITGLHDTHLIFRVDRLAGDQPRNIEVARNQTMVASSLMGDARVEQQLATVAVADARIEGARLQGTYSLSAADLLQLLVDAGAVASADLALDTAVLDNSRFLAGSGNDALTLASRSALRLLAGERVQQADLDLAIRSTGMRNSTVELGDGHDVITVRAAVEGQPAAGYDYGVDLLLGALDQIPVQLALRLEAVGLDRSQLIAGDGNDRISVITAIDDLLEADLAGLDPAVSRFDVSRERISLRDSLLDAGAGDDLVVLRGDVVNSTIQLGSGVNQLFLQGDLRDSSRVLSDSPYVMVQLPLVRRSETLTSGNDRWEVRNVGEIQNLDGGDGVDTLVSSGRQNSEAVAITGINRGHLWSMGFESVESLELGDGDDVVLIQNLGGLSGQILAGRGIDTLDFSDSWLPAVLNLQTGTLNRVAGGVDGFERILGSPAADSITLPWTPWLHDFGADLASDFNGGQERSGYALTGGAGADLFTLVGVGAPLPDAWDGRSGLPVLRDLNLAEGDRIAYSLDDQDGAILLTSPFPSDDPAVRRLPIAPLETLRAGWQDPSPGLGLALAGDSGGGRFDELHLLGSDGPGSSRLLALVSRGSAQGLGRVEELLEPVAD